MIKDFKSNRGGSLQVGMFFRSFVNVRDYTYTQGGRGGALLGYGYPYILTTHRQKTSSAVLFPSLYLNT